MNFSGGCFVPACQVLPPLIQQIVPDREIMQVGIPKHMNLPQRLQNRLVRRSVVEGSELMLFEVINFSSATLPMGLAGFVYGC